MLHPTLPGGATMSRPFGSHERSTISQSISGFLYTLCRAQDVFLPSIRTSSRAIHLAGLSGLRKMREIIWDDGHFIINANFLTLSKVRQKAIQSTILCTQIRTLISVAPSELHNHCTLPSPHRLGYKAVGASSLRIPLQLCRTK